MIVRGKFCYFCRDNWNLSSLTPIASIHVFGFAMEGIVLGLVVEVVRIEEGAFSTAHLVNLVAPLVPINK